MVASSGSGCNYSLAAATLDRDVEVIDSATASAMQAVKNLGEDAAVSGTRRAPQGQAGSTADAAQLRTAAIHRAQTKVRDVMRSLQQREQKAEHEDDIFTHEVLEPLTCALSHVHVVDRQAHTESCRTSDTNRVLG